MHQRRLIKQATYAGGCLSLVGIFLVIIIASLLPYRTSRPAPPEPTPVFQSIIVERVDSIPHGQTTDLVARLRNPNPRAGISELPVTFTFVDTAGQELARHAEMSYVLPGSIQYVIALNVPLPSNLAAVNVSLPTDPAFTALPAELTLPTFTTFLRQHANRSIGEQTFEEQRGIVTNNSPFDFHRVEVAVVALGPKEQAIGVGKTLLGTLTVGEQREFVAQWPTPAQATERVIVLATTNIFREDNVVEVIGDPARLR